MIPFHRCPTETIIAEIGEQNHCCFPQQNLHMAFQPSKVQQICRPENVDKFPNHLINSKNNI